MAFIIKILLFFAGTLLMVVAGYVFSKRKTTRTVGIAGFCLFSAVYAFGYMIEIGANNSQEIYDALKIQYLGIGVLPIFVLFSVIDFTDISRKTSKLMVKTMVSISIMTILVVMTNEVHHWYYQSIDFSIINGLTISKLEPGFWYVAFVGYLYFSISSAVIIFLVKYFKARKGLKRQYVILFYGSLIPVGAGFLYHAGFTPYGADIVPLSLCLTGLLLAYGLASNQLVVISSYIRESVFDSMNLKVAVFDKRNCIVDFNHGMIELASNNQDDLVGYSAEEAFSNYPRLVELIENDEYFNHSSRDFVPEYEVLKSRFEDSWIVRKNDRYEKVADFREKIIKLKTLDKENERFFSVSKFLILDSASKIQCKYIVIGDVTKETHYINKLNYLANYDAMTEILNRASFLEESKLVLDKAPLGERVSMFVIDVDHFKRVNDIYGHPAGDEVLKDITWMISQNLAEEDLFGRIGGEEFAVLINGVDREKVHMLAERIRRRIETLDIYHKDEKINVTISIGVVFVRNQEGLTVEKLIQHGDVALYKAKNNGRNKVALFG